MTAAGASEAPAAPRLIEALRALEPFCYQVVYYLLTDERRAEAAAREALLEAARSAGFAKLPPAERRQVIKRCAIRHALASAGRQR